MLFPLKYVEECGLYNFIEVPAHFFKRMITAEAYGDDLFPGWFVPVLNKSPKLQEEFEELANTILEKNRLQRKRVYSVFLNNNRISRLCENKNFPLKLLDNDLQDVAGLAKKVLVRLYDSTLQGALVKKELGDGIHDHYEKFRDINISQACPFCGLENYPDRIKNTRSQYDHYLNKAKYYFSSVNFENLVPMCNICNEAPNKHMKDILFDVQNGDARRLAFYPYSDFSGAKLTVINVSPSEVGDGGQWNVTVAPVDVNEQEQIEAWKCIFNTEERYAARVSEEAENWIVEFIVKAEIPCAEADVNAWRDTFQAWSETLSYINERKVVRNGVLNQAYFEYLFRDAPDSEIVGIMSLARSDMFAVRQLAVG